MVNNHEFLSTIFGENIGFVHVTDFTHDPSRIPHDQILFSWLGDYYNRYKFKEGITNQYFTVSVFNPAEGGKARRRKSLFLYCPVIVLDDVREKLSIEAVKMLPEPSYIMETSPGSEQWGYILSNPVSDRYRVENLINGMIRNGLCPDGKDPGMKGVTRYVRLPDGYNTKASKMVNGIPFKCRLTLWEPQTTATIEQLAAPFCINLDFKPTEGNATELADIPTHPVLNAGLTVKSRLSAGRYDIECPWLDEHSDRADTGTALFTNKDGSVGFKCHHGHCEDRGVSDLIRHIEETRPTFGNDYRVWLFHHLDGNHGGTEPSKTESIDFFQQQTVIPAPPQSTHGTEQNPNSIEVIAQTIRSKTPGTQEQRDSVNNFLKVLEGESQLNAQHYYTEVRDVMGWGKTEFNNILRGLRKEWYEQGGDNDIYKTFVYIRDQDRLYDYRTGIFYNADAFQRSFSDVDPDAKKRAFTEGIVQKVDKMDFAPKKPKIFRRGEHVIANGWDSNGEIQGNPGDCSKWLNHWEVLGWSEHQKHMLQYMAFTILHPDQKINHVLLLAGNEGIGKDFILRPLIHALGDYSTTIQGNELLSGFNDYLFSTKHLHINEVELGDHKKVSEVSANIKPLAAAPPDTLRCNIKFANPLRLQNIVNVTMSSNSKLPIRLSGISRRFYATWTDLDIRDNDCNIKPEWVRYWHDCWEWMKNGGVENCIHYLRNCVDLSDFNPGSVPKITEFMREISDSSKSPGQLTIEAFIDNELGVFKRDLVTPDEILQTLKAGVINHQSYMFTEANWFTTMRISRIMNDIKGVKKYRARGEKEMTLWATKNTEEYDKLKSNELYHKYMDQRRVT